MRFLLLRLAYGTLAGLLIGLLAGSGEVVYLTYTQLKILMTPAQWTGLFGVALAGYGGLGAAVGLVASLVLAPLTGRGQAVRYYREAMRRDLLAGFLAPVIGIAAAAVGLVVVSPWLLAAFRREGGTLWGAAVVVLVLAVAGSWTLVLHRLLRRRDEGQPGVVPLWLPVPALVLVLFLAGVVREPAGGKGFGSHVNQALPNLVVITLDTYRADHLSWYGHPVATTPTLDYFARKNVSFPSAVCPMPETAPSHASMMTGLHPLAHGVMDNATPLGEDAETLAEYLAGQGYSTGAFVSAYSLDRDLRLDQGFSVYDDDLAGGVRGQGDLALWRLRTWLAFRLGQPAELDDLERDAADTNERVYEWLARHAGENFFLWVHYFDPHAPYEPHGLAGFEANGTPADPTVDHAAILDERRNTYRADEIEPLKRTYAEECSYTDRRLGELLRTLEDYRLFDRSVIVIVGDHGESLGEHDIHFSHMGLYDPTVRVPMMLRAPSLGDGARVVEDQVRVQDLFPTSLQLMGFRYAAPMDGKTLVPRIRGEESGDLQALLVGRMGKLGDGLWVGLRERQWKYLRSPPPEAREEFYLLDSDPDELDDVAATHEQAVKAARAGVNATLGGTTIDDPAGAGMSAEQRARLEALGYVEGSE